MASEITSHERPFPAPSKRRTFRHSLLANFLILGIFFAFLIIGIWNGFSGISVENYWSPQTVVLTDTNGTEMRRIYLEKDRLELTDDAFPDSLKNAVIAIEDERFSTRSCIDLKAITRAALADVTKDKVQGASTITQQLVGNLLLDRSDKSFARKFVELMLSCRLEHAAPKERILGLYLNHMPFGGTIYGAEEASQTYFSVSARHLTMTQSVVLASLLKAPTYYSPYGIHQHTAIPPVVASAIRRGTIRTAADIPPEAISYGLLGTWFIGPKGKSMLYLEGRTDLVLQSMRSNGFINKAQVTEAREELKSMRFERRESVISLPYFALFVQKQLNTGMVHADRLCDARSGGCIVQTTIDPQYQDLAESIVLEHAQEIREKYHAKNIALVAADRATGHILAYVGNVRFGDTEMGSMVDMAQVPRQPGSSFKPFVYATAFGQGMNPDTFLLDAPLTLGTDHPRNYEGGYRSWTSISHALAASRNIPAIRTLLFVGGEVPILQTAARAGITTPMETREAIRQTDPQFSFGYPLAIGSAEVPLLEMVQGYATLANAGIYRPLSAIKSIRTVEGQPLDSKLSEGGTQAIDPLSARWLTSILSDTSIRPTAAWNKALTIPGIQTAIKTGTSNRCISFDFTTQTCTLLLPGDVWTMGYTPEFVLGIWIGNADNTPLTASADGMNVAAPLWKEFIQAAHELRPDGQMYFPPELIVRKGRGN
ncbi:MAG: transglycosylase domain-containing protein [Candidatus Peregrinibacteria bacterium]